MSQMVITRIVHYKIVKHALMRLIAKHAYKNMLLILGMFAFCAILLGARYVVVKIFALSAI